MKLSAYIFTIIFAVIFYLLYTRILGWNPWANLGPFTNWMLGIVLGILIYEIFRGRG